MKKKLSFIIFFIIIIISLLLPKSFADLQDAIESIIIEANIQENGDAEITEEWITTEINNSTYYKKIPNLSSEQIQNITIQETTQNEKYVYEENWKELTEAERENKFFVENKEDGIVINWTGKKSSFHAYELKYTVKSFVKQFTDKQGFCFDFLSDDINIIPYAIEVNIKAPFEFSEKNVKLTKFGFDGNVKIDQGNISITDVKAFKTIKILGEFKTKVLEIQNNSDYSIKQLKNELQQEYPKIVKNEDKIIIGILIGVSILYIILEAYYLMNTKSNKKNSKK